MENGCCCEYVNEEGDRAHVLCCFCNCAALDAAAESFLSGKSRSENNLRRVLHAIDDRSRVPWPGGAIKVRQSFWAIASVCLAYITISSFSRPVLILGLLGFVVQASVKLVYDSSQFVAQSLLWKATYSLITSFCLLLFLPQGYMGPASSYTFIIVAIWSSFFILPSTVLEYAVDASKKETNRFSETRSKRIVACCFTLLTEVVWIISCPVELVDVLTERAAFTRTGEGLMAALTATTWFCVALDCCILLILWSDLRAERQRCSSLLRV